MQADPIFKQTAACGLTRTKTTKDFCARLDRTKTALAKADQSLNASAPDDPEPNITMFKEYFGWPVPNIRLGLAVWPVLLAELCGSLGFYLSSRTASELPVKAPRPVEPSWWRRALRYRPRWKRPPKPAPDPPAPKPDAPCAPTPAPAIQWPTLVRPETA